jgi:hypothetical protein
VYVAVQEATNTNVRDAITHPWTKWALRYVAYAKFLNKDLVAEMAAKASKRIPSTEQANPIRAKGDNCNGNHQDNLSKRLVTSHISIKQTFVRKALVEAKCGVM